MRKLASIVCFAALLGCDTIRNDVDLRIATCGQGTDPELAHVRIADPARGDLPGDDLRAAWIVGDEVRLLRLTERGCVGLPRGERGLLLVADREGRGSLAETLEARDAYETPLALQKGAVGPFVAGAILPQCPAAGVTSGALSLNLTSSPSSGLHAYRMRSRIRGRDGFELMASYALVDPSADEINEIAALEPSLPEGDYELLVEIEDIFAKTQEQKPLRCPIRIDRTAPVPARFEPPKRLAGDEDVAAVPPGYGFALEAHDASSTRLFTCLTAEVEGSAGVECRDGFHLESRTPFAPESGLWTLHYYFEDAAGNRSAVQRLPFAVVHEDVIAHAVASAEHAKAKIERGSVIDGLQAAFEALLTHDQLELAAERRLVEPALLDMFWSIDPRLWETARYQAGPGSVVGLIALPEERVAALQQSGRLVILDAAGRELRTFHGLGRIESLKRNEILGITRTGALEIVDTVGGTRRRLLPDGSADMVRVGLERVATYSFRTRTLRVIGLDGVLLGETLAQSRELGPFHPSASAMLLFDERSVVLWDWQSGAERSVFEIGEPSCRIMTTGVSTDGRWLYVGTADSRFIEPYIVVNEAAPACGLKRVDLTTGDVESMVYAFPHSDYPAAERRTPNSVNELLVTEDGRLIARSMSSHLLTIWDQDSVEGWNKAATSGRHVSVRTFTAAPDQLVVIDDQARVTLYEKESLREPQNDVYTSQLPSIGASPSVLAVVDRSRIVVGDHEGNVRFLSLEPQNTLAHIGTTRPEAAAWSARESGRIAVTKDQSTVQILVPGNGAGTVAIQTDSPVRGLAALTDALAVATQSSLALHDLNGDILDWMAVEGILELEASREKLLVRTRDRVLSFDVERGRLTKAHEVPGRFDAARFASDGKSYVTLVRQGERVLEKRRLSDGLVLEAMPDALALVGDRFLVSNETETGVSTHLVGAGSTIELKACNTPIADIEARGERLFLRCQHDKAYRVYDGTGELLGALGDEIFGIDRIRLSEDGSSVLGMQGAAPEVRMWRLLDIRARASDLCRRYLPYLDAVASRGGAWAERSLEFCHAGRR